jgi:predicted acyl esterase
MLGASYLGIVQWRAATLRNPNLKAIFPIFSGGDEYLDRFYSPGGAMKFGHRLLWISENLRAPGFKPPDFNRFVRKRLVNSSSQAAVTRHIVFSWRKRSSRGSARQRRMSGASASLSKHAAACP